jgi:hypothetical protein
MGHSETVIDKSRKLLGILSVYCEKLPRDKKFTTGDKIITIALNLLENIIQAYYGERRSKIEKISQANIKLEVLRQILRYLFETNVHDMKKHEHFNKEITSLGESIGAWRKQLTHDHA